MKRWELLHLFWEEDFAFEMKQRQAFVDMLKKHPDDRIGELLRKSIKAIDKRIGVLKVKYKKVYGSNFKLRGLYEQ